MKEGRKESSEYQMMTGVSYTCGEKKKKKRKKADETQWSSGGTLPYVSLYKHDSMPNGGSSVKLSNPKRFSVVNHVWRLVVVFNDQSGSVSSAPLPAQDSRGRGRAFGEDLMSEDCIIISQPIPVLLTTVLQIYYLYSTYCTNYELQSTHY